MKISAEDPATPDVAALLGEHLTQMRRTSPDESVHALDVDGLRARGVALWAARDDDGQLQGVGALAELDPSHGEIKSMRTAAAHRGRGVGTGVLAHLLDEARRRGYARVSLETGSQDFFAAAHRLYERFGFEPCPPFAGYAPGPHSRFFCIALVAPEPHNPARMGWDDVADAVRATVEAAAGAPITEVRTARTGFSPGFAGLVSFDGAPDVFVKAISAARHPHSVGLNRREAAVVPTLPHAAGAAPLLWVEDDGDWLVTAFEALDGTAPVAPGDGRDEAAVWRAFADLSEVRVAPGAGLQPFHEMLGDIFDRWAALAAAEDKDDRLRGLGSLAPWIDRNLDSLMRWEAQGIEHSVGDRLVHGDARTDNMLVVDGEVRLVDWPWACVGAPWLDLVGSLPVYATAGGGPAHARFHDHPLSEGVSREAERAIVAALAGYFCVASTEPEPPSLPGLRAFQRAQALPAIDWLRTVAPELT